MLLCLFCCHVTVLQNVLFRQTVERLIIPAAVCSVILCYSLGLCVRDAHLCQVAEEEARLIYGSPFTAERIVWKISRLHKNCLKNEICDYILFISGLRQHGTWERATPSRRDGAMVQCAAAPAAVHRSPDYRPHSFHKQTRLLHLAKN